MSKGKGTVSGGRGWWGGGKPAELLDFKSWCSSTTKCTGLGEVKGLIFKCWKKRWKCPSVRSLIRKSLRQLVDMEPNLRSLEPHFSSAAWDRFPTTTSRLEIASDEGCKQIMNFFFFFFALNYLTKWIRSSFKCSLEVFKNDPPAPRSHTVLRWFHF